MCAYIYIVECADRTLYTGWTTNLEKRIRAHNLKRGAKYTRSRTPVRLVYAECFATERQARQREYAIKQLSRREKLMLIESGAQYELYA